MKFLISVLFSLTALTLEAQDLKKVKHDLSYVATVAQAKAFLEKKEVKGEVFEADSRADSSEIDRQLLMGKAGDLLEFQSDDKTKQLIFKILEVREVRSFRVQYIFLDNKKLGIDQIDSLKKIIFGKLENGETFGTLARQYSMDGNSKKNGDLGWFEEGQMMKEFEDKVKSHQLGEVYTVDISDKKWYYVVKNTHPPKADRKVVVLYLEVNIRP